MLPTFDIRGNLFPAQKVNVAFDDLRDIWVNSFDPTSTRHILFEGYMRFLADFSSRVSPSFIQWINGSFISNCFNPKDIDFVTFIDADTYHIHQAIIDQQFRLENARNLYEVDAYTIRAYPEQHEKRWQTEMDMAY